MFIKVLGSKLKKGKNEVKEWVKIQFLIQIEASLIGLLGVKWNGPMTGTCCFIVPRMVYPLSGWHGAWYGGARGNH